MKKIFPVEGKVILSRDDYVRIGKYVIGAWRKYGVCGTFHYRPSPYEGSTFYTADLSNGSSLREWTMSDLRRAILESCKDGIEPIECEE